jgi:methylated-DNA-[protein]-cysteine S-methyltransferase
MGQTAHHYLIFDTEGGFCGIAWNNVGITRFQLPTKSAEAAERALLRRVPGAERGAPTPEVVEAVAAVKRYFEGEETDFSGFTLDLGEQDPFFKQIYAAARRVRWGRTTTYGTLAKELGAGPEAARDVGQAIKEPRRPYRDSCCSGRPLRNGRHPLVNASPAGGPGDIMHPSVQNPGSRSVLSS